MRCETRTLDDIRALGGNDIEHEHRFGRIRRSHPGAGRLALAEFKTMMREQYFVLVNDEPEVLAAIMAPSCR